MRTASWTKQAWQERMDAKLAVAHGTLAAQVAALQSGEDWKRFLDLQASLHSYSPNNVMLITAQHAKALPKAASASPSPAMSPGSRRGKRSGGRLTKVSTGTWCSRPAVRAVASPSGTTASRDRSPKAMHPAMANE